jgi:hypothetical protein
MWKRQKASAEKGGNKMRYSKMLAWVVMAAGVMVTGAQAKAEDRDLRGDYARVDHLRNDIAADRARLNEDLRCHRPWAAENDRRDLARDQAALNYQLRDVRHDRRW